MAVWSIICYNVSKSHDDLASFGKTEEGGYMNYPNKLNSYYYLESWTTEMGTRPVG